MTRYVARRVVAASAERLPEYCLEAAKDEGIDAAILTAALSPHRCARVRLLRCGDRHLPWHTLARVLRLEWSIAWVPCDGCEDFWCLIHGSHAYDCSCPEFDDWVLEPYAPGSNPLWSPLEDQAFGRALCAAAARCHNENSRRAPWN